MSRKKWVYSLTLRIKNIRIARGLSLVCNQCKKELNIGDDIYSRNAHCSKSKSKLYHVGCAERLNII